ncbi:hypothetical protein GO986_19745 [Deinococcus sp. HMF7620]|uniref:Uncharacterized protein n=1 Tax=Deinococcus arboris TaxID=2682977 RepID=A0A7C9LNH1_9DEIO|nr:hypothetical protein [Deinococcus arboris]MVN88978.1 hypothetical protein [Deinococcus arboris]
MNITRLPAIPPPPQPSQALPPAITSGGITYPLSGGAVTVTRGAITTPLNVTPRQTARGRTWASGSRTAKAVSVTLTFQVEASNAETLAALANQWHALALLASAYWEGISALTILEPTESQEPFGEGLTRTFTVTYLLAGPLWAAEGHDPHPAPLAGDLNLPPIGSGTPQWGNLWT